LILVIVNPIGLLHLKYRSPVACGQAFHFFNGDLSIRSGFSHPDIQLVTQFICECLRASKDAWQIGAHLNAVFATFPIVIKGVEAHQRGDLCRLEPDQITDFRNGFSAQRAIFALREEQERHNGRSLLIGRIFCQDAFDFLSVIFFQHVFTDLHRRVLDPGC